MLVASCIAFTEAQTTFEQVNGFMPRFLPPPNMGFADVKADYGAKGDGTTDDTQAFKKAMADVDARVIYIPAGRYIIREQLRPADGKKRMLIIGESRATTILCLADGSSGFGSASSPKVFIHTRADAQQGEQNMANFVYHLTIEIGKNNAGAIGLNFHTNNTGAVKDLTIRAADPVNHRGLHGLAIGDYWFGPGNARYLDIEGFATGVHIGDAKNHATLEHISIKNCGVGLHATGGVSVRKLKTAGCGLAVNSRGGLALIESHLGGSGSCAIDNTGRLLCRDVATEGFGKAIKSSTVGGDLAGPKIAHYTSSAATYNWKPAADMNTTLGLKVEESPEYQYPSADGWTAIPSTVNDLDIAVNNAIEAGAEDILVAQGTGPVFEQIILKKNVRRIMSAGPNLVQCLTFENAAFRLEDGAADAVIVEFMYLDYTTRGTLTCEQASSRTLVFRHGSGGYRSMPAGAGGKVFIESVVGQPFHFDKVCAWVRDLNTEQGGPGLENTNVVNTGAVLWILGHKTEDWATKIYTRTGGYTELLNATYRQNWSKLDRQQSGIDLNDQPPLFLVEDSHVSKCYWEGGYEVSVREKRSNETRNYKAKDTPLFVGYANKTPPNISVQASRRGSDCSRGAVSAMRARFMRNGKLHIEGLSSDALVHAVKVFDGRGRIVAWSAGSAADVRIHSPNTGTYLVRLETRTGAHTLPAMIMR
jgi:hypothetical protein